MKRVVIIGSGNLAEALAQAVATSDWELVQICGRNRERVEAVASLAHTPWTTDFGAVAAADLYIISVSDGAVAQVAKSLQLPAGAEGAVVAHTAGCVPIDVLAVSRRAVIYPLQTFTKGRRVDFAEIPIFTEASTEEVWREVDSFAAALSRKCYHADGECRRKIHLAGVFANNFANNMFAVAARRMGEIGLPSEVLHPIITETARKAVAAEAPELVQTGPAVRGDVQTQQSHIELLAHEALLTEIYKTISQNIWEISKKI